jgi:hypothetical protein
VLLGPRGIRRRLALRLEGLRMSRASLLALARLPLHCSAECATPTNTSPFENFRRKLANAPPLLNHSALALFARRTRIPTPARSIGFFRVIWVCISSSSSIRDILCVICYVHSFDTGRSAKTQPNSVATAESCELPA